jgi:23S rRNA (cytidine2498-2'-O)-methyltransferase
MTPYVFATCRVGAEVALKAEADKLGLRPAFARPGFVSFKSEVEITPAYVFPSVFAHAFGASFDRTTPDKLPAVARVLAKRVRASRVHVFARDWVNDDDEPSELAELAAMLDPGVDLPRGQAKLGETVLDVLLVDPNVVVLGAHVHTDTHSPFAGGVPPLVLPEASPSRAWLKFEEALLWHGVSPRPNETAIEIGSAPGGTAYALTQRGLRVFAVDPAAMDASLANAKMPDGRLAMVHVKKPAAHLSKLDIDAKASWLLIDVNDTPETTLNLAQKTLGLLDARPKLILTLKMSDWAKAKNLELHRERVTRWGYADVRLKQLALGRREVVVLAD